MDFWQASYENYGAEVEILSKNLISNQSKTAWRCYSSAAPTPSDRLVDSLSRFPALDEILAYIETGGVIFVVT